MGCALFVVAALLAFAIPASIAPASLVGAYIVIAVLAATVVAALLALRRRPGARAPAAPFIWVATLTASYVVLVTVIHVTAR